MKKFRIIAFVLAVLLVAGIFAGCGKAKKEVSTDGTVVKWFSTFDMSPDNKRVFELINKRVEELTGCTIEWVSIDDSQYDLQFSSGEEIDLIYAPDHRGYWQNAEKGAFMELTEEDFKTYAPYIWENGKEQLDTAKSGGKYYVIPAIGDSWSADRVYAARGDLMDKYGIDSLNTIDDIDEFLMAVADGKNKGEHNVIAYNTSGGGGYMIFVMWAADWGWANPGSLSYASHYYYNLFDDEFKLFLGVDQPEVKEYSEKVKAWYDNGVFSKSILSANVSSEENFRNGKSALAWINSPAAGNLLYNDLKKIKGADKWDVRFYSLYQKYQRAFNYANYGTAIGATSKKKEACLKVLNAVLANKDLYYMIQYGEEGVHFTMGEEGYVPLETTEDKTYSAPWVSLRNTKFDFKTKYDYPYAEDLVAELKSKTVNDPLVNCPIRVESGDSQSMKVRLDDVYNEYSMPRLYGAVNDVDKAIATEKKALQVAGIEKYLKGVQAQVDAYVAEHPEAMKKFRENRKAVEAYLKENPNKTNPKDYK